MDLRKSQLFWFSIFILALLPTIFFGLDPLRIDEYGSLWVADRALSEVWDTSLEIQGQSPLYYLLLSIWHHYLLIPPRCLSFLLGFVAIVYVGRIAKTREVNPWLICSYLALTDAFLGGAVNVRPYILAIATLLSGVYYLLQNNISGQIVGTLLLVLTYYAHYVFLPVIMLVYAVWFICRKSRALFLSVAAFTCLSLPSLWQLARLRGIGHRYAFLAMPTWQDLLVAYGEPVSLLVIVLIAVCYVTALEKRAIISDLLFILALILLPPLVNFTITYIQGYSIFLPRYYAGILLGQVGGFIIAARVLGRSRGFAFYASSLALLLTCYQLSNDLDRSYEDWASVKRQMLSLGADSQCHTFAFTGFVEAGNLSYLDKGILQQQFISSPLLFNQIEAQLLPPSFLASEEHQEFFRTQVAPHFTKDCLTLVTRNYPLVIYDEPYKFKVYEPSFFTIPKQAEQVGYEIKIARRGELSFVVKRKS